MMKFKIKHIQRVKNIAVLAVIICLVPFTLVAQQTVSDLIDRGVAAGLDQSQLERVMDRANERGVEASDLQRLIEPAINLAERDLPSDYIVQKLMEGFSKGVPPGRMMPLMDNIHENTPRAVSIADNWTGKPEVASFMERAGDRAPQFQQELINANLKSLTQQVGPDELEGVLESIGQESVLEKTSPRAIVAAVGILSDLPASAREGNAARGLLARAAEAGFSASDFQKLPGAMNAAERRSQLPAASVIEGVAAQLGSGIPASEVLQNLFNGNVNVGPPGNRPGRPNNGPGRGQGSGNNS